MTQRRWLIASAIALALLLLLGRLVADLYTSYAWYDALGATSVWRAKVGTLTVIRIAEWIAASLFALGHLFTVRQSVVSLVVQRQLGGVEFAESFTGRHLTGAAVALALALGAGLALAQTNWTTAFLAGSGAAFGATDPYFGADLGCFVFWLPFEAELWTWMLFVVLTTTAVVVALYVITAGARIEGGRLRTSTHARRHLTVIVGLMLMMLAWHFRLEMYELLMNGSGPDGAFGYLDHRVRVPAALVLSLVTLVSGLIVMTAGVGSQRMAIGTTVSVLLLWAVARQLAPAIVRRATHDADPIARERPYIATQAGYTRRAYGIDRIEMSDSSATFKSVDSAVSAAALWDDLTLRLAIDPATPVDTMASWIGWRPSARSPVADIVHRTVDATGSRETWTVMTVDGGAADPSGDIVPIADALGRIGSGGDRTVHPPLIYPGATSYDVIADSSHRVVGVPIDSRLSRIAHAWSLQSPQFVAGHLAEPRPTLVDVRDVRERLDRLVPFFVQGRTVTPLVVADTVYWVVELYAASNWYPLSAPIPVGGEDWRYFRHAAVAVVDGFSGDVMIVPDDNLDALAAVWIRRFQTLFTTAAALPAGVRDMLPATGNQLLVQATAFGRFGLRTTDFETRHVPASLGGDSDVVTGGPIALLRNRSAITTSLPLVDSTDRVRGVMISVGGANRRTIWIESANGPRWSALGDRFRGLDSTTGRRAPRPLHAAIRVLPVAKRLVFSEPVFAYPSGDSPTLDYLGVIDGDSARRLTGLRRDGTPVAGGDLRAQVQTVYAAMRSALQRGDWAAFGRAMESLSRISGGASKR
jgi:uncharacterized protein